MSERPQTISERATPDEWLKRLEIFRERFRLGLIDETRFKEIARAFQFTDDLGHIWMPGATSQQWYRWDRTKWTAANPPQELAAANLPVAIAMTWNRELVAPIELKPKSNLPSATPPPPEPPRATVETRVPEPIAKDTNLIQEKSVPVQIETPPMEIKPTPVVSAPPPPSMPELTRAKCPHCGESYIAPAKFCPHCGNLITGAPKKTGRPTDLPERGATRSQSKPKDLPR